VAHHQDRLCPPSAGYPGTLPLQHAGVHGEEDDGRLRGLLDFNNSLLILCSWKSGLPFDKRHHEVIGFTL